MKEEVEREMLLSKNVEMAKLLGFKDQKIARALTKQFRENQENFATFYEFKEKLMQEPAMVLKSKLTMNRAKELLDKVKCNKCREEESCVMYLPCAHISENFSCSRKSHLRTLCGDIMEEKILTYRV